MMNSWVVKNLSDIAEVIDSRHKTPKYSEIGLPMVRAVDIQGGALNLENTRKVSEEVYEDFSKGRDPQIGDIIISRVGHYCGQFSFVSSNDKFCLGQNTAFIIPKSINSRYFYYQLVSPLIQYQIDKFAVGAAQKTISLKSIKQFEVITPPLLEQKAIAHILGTLDDKIELNRQMNEILEAMAQSLFQSWFVDFDPVIDNALLAGKTIPEPLKEHAELRQAQLDSGKAKTNSEINDSFPSEFEFTEELGWIPKGWDIKPLDEIADYLNGLALQKFRPETPDEDFLPVLKIAQLRAGEPNFEERASLDIKPEYIVQDGDIIFSWSGSLLVDVWCGGKAALNQHLFKVTSEDYPKWFYYYYTKHHLEEFQRIAAYKAVTMGHIKRSHLKEALCLVPDNLLENKELYSSFEVILNRLIQNKTESRILAKLRDTLLPKLMSGELRIPDAEKLVADI